MGWERGGEKEREREGEGKKERERNREHHIIEDQEKLLFTSYLSV